MARNYGTASYGSGLFQGGSLEELAAANVVSVVPGGVEATRTLDADARMTEIASGFLLLDVFSPLAAIGTVITFAWVETRRAREVAVAPVSRYTQAEITSSVDIQGAGVSETRTEFSVAAKFTWIPAPGTTGTWADTTTDTTAWDSTSNAPVIWH